MSQLLPKLVWMSTSLGTSSSTRLTFVALTCQLLQLLRSLVCTIKIPTTAEHVVAQSIPMCLGKRALQLSSIFSCRVEHPSTLYGYWQRNERTNAATSVDLVCGISVRWRRWECSVADHGKLKRH